MLPLIFACISGFLVIGTAIFQYSEKTSAEKKASDRQIALDSANAKVVSLLNEVNEKNREIIEVQQKLNSKSEYISNYITGGEGFPYVSFTDLISENSTAELAFIIYNDGEFPMYDIDGTMYNYDILRQKEVDTKGMGGEFEKHPDYKMIKYDDYKSANILSVKLSLPPKSMRYIDHKFPLQESNYCFIINSRNGLITERIAFVKDTDKKFLFIIEIFDAEEKLLKRIVGKYVNEKNKDKIENAINKIPKSLKYVFMN